MSVCLSSFFTALPQWAYLKMFLPQTNMKVSNKPALWLLCWCLSFLKTAIQPNAVLLRCLLISILSQLGVVSRMQKESCPPPPVLNEPHLWCNEICQYATEGAWEINSEWACLTWIIQSRDREMLLSDTWNMTAAWWEIIELWVTLFSLTEVIYFE